MTVRNYINGAPLLTLSVAVNTTGVTLEVLSTAGFPEPPFILALERGTVNEEVVLCTGKTADTFTVTRAWDGTTGKNHSIGAAIEHTTAAIDYVEANTHINSTGDVHPQYVLKTAYTAKGRFLIASAANTPTSIAVGADATVLQADASTVTGMKWAQIGAASIAPLAIDATKLTTVVERGLVSRQGSNPTAEEGRINFRSDLSRWYGYRGGWKLIPFGAGQITVSTAAPSGGSDGDIHFRY